MAVQPRSSYREQGPDEIRSRSEVMDGTLNPNTLAELDAADITRSLNGDGEAFGRIVERYQSKMAARMWRFTRNTHDHEDLVQEVFVQAYVSLATYRASAPFEHWLSRIATIVGYKFWKRSSREGARHVVAIEEWHSVLEQSDDQIEPSRAADLVEALLDRLPPRDRLVLMLRHVEERTVEECARLTGWTETMVKVQAWRARKKLRKLLLDAGV